MTKEKPKEIVIKVPFYIEDPELGLIDVNNDEEVEKKLKEYNKATKNQKKPVNKN